MENTLRTSVHRKLAHYENFKNTIIQVFEDITWPHNTNVDHYYGWAKINKIIVGKSSNDLNVILEFLRGKINEDPLPEDKIKELSENAD